VGSWKSPLSIDITDRTRLRQQLGWLNAWSLLCLARWPRFLGTWYLKTTVAYDPGGQVEHTTRFTLLGIPVVSSIETIQIEEDGTHFSLTGWSRDLFTPWQRKPVTGQGHLDSSATHASYTIQWMGAPVEQKTERDGQRVTLTQRGPGFQLVHALSPD